MVQGTSSWAGKSLLVTALARLIARRGIAVAPFKGQNMSNNARVVRGGEIGVAQYLQALAARVEPDVRMNPVLVKPEGDNRSQVVVLGAPDLKLSRAPWRDPAREPLARDRVVAALARVGVRAAADRRGRQPGGDQPAQHGPRQHACRAARRCERAPRRRHRARRRVRAPVRDVGAARAGRPRPRPRGSC